MERGRFLKKRTWANFEKDKKFSSPKKKVVVSNKKNNKI